MIRFFTGVVRQRRLRRKALALALAASLGGAAFAASAALANSTGSATVYYDRNSCLGTQSTGATADVSYTRSGKVIDVDVRLNSGWSTGAHGVLLFVLTPNGSCPPSGQFLGAIPSGSSTATFSAKIQPARGGRDITVVLCIGESGPHFSTPATLEP